MHDSRTDLSSTLTHLLSVRSSFPGETPPARPRDRHVDRQPTLPLDQTWENIVFRQGCTEDGTPWACFDGGGDWLAAAQETRTGWIVALVSKLRDDARILEWGLEHEEAVARARFLARALYHTAAPVLVTSRGRRR